VLQAVRTVSET